MEGEILRFYLHERLEVNHQPAWEWLLREARDAGIEGGSAMRTIGGFGRDRELREYKFFELADSQAIVVEFLLRSADAELLLARVRDRRLSVFFARTPAIFGSTSPASGENP